jgi:Fe-S-cluster-containing dehydrogenase component/anaerobic selenocysteine-containing dehydrogenase
MEKKYWKSLNNIEDKLDKESEIDLHKKHFLDEYLSDEKVASKTNRRDFLKYCGFGVSTAALAASCENPVNKAITYLNQPEENLPGKATYYASTYFDGKTYCPIIVKTRDGRPIKIEGNELSVLSNGGTNAQVQASVLTLYDGARYEGPISNNAKTTWTDVDSEVNNILGAIAEKNGSIVLLTQPIISPSTKQVISEFLKKYTNSKHIQTSLVNYNGILEANEKCFGSRFIPSYKFNKVEVIVSFEADFLGTWINPIEFANQYSKTRKLDKKKTMSRHIQFESGMTLTGSNADERYAIHPNEETIILLNIYNELAKMTGLEKVPIADSQIDIKGITKELWDAKGKSIVVSGSNNTDNQIIVNQINELLENYNTVIDTLSPLNYNTSENKEYLAFLNDLEQNNIDAIIIQDVNILYQNPDSEKLWKALQNAKLSVSFSQSPNETDKYIQYICPSHHYLESWNDFEYKKGICGLSQPSIKNIFNTRQFQETLLKWTGNNMSYLDFVKKNWEENYFENQNKYNLFNDFWNYSLQKGEFVYEAETNEKEFSKQDLNQIHTLESNSLVAKVYLSTAIEDGFQSNNPWLQELPDAITKVTWDNFAAISPKLASEKELEDGDIIELQNNFKVPVLVQPGQAYNTISIAFGYGRTNVGKVADGVGVNIFELLNDRNQIFDSVIKIDESTKTGKNIEFARTQTHNSMEGRAIVRETTLKEYIEKPNAGNEMHEEFEKLHLTLYPETEFEGHHWAMAIDLNSCIGCNNCVISCQAENNVAVIGKDEVRNRRIMHWMKMDRYYSDDAENPEVYHQPIMCQHCDNAPCENVCPVSATMHSNEGLNQIAYNRCIGTKYCINNCPYKVRRFNWYKYANNDKFDYNQNSDLGKMILNPDVTVRERGVVEKCSFCVQRIQEKKLEAKLQNRTLKDGEVKPACVQSCPTNAIVFGDLKDKQSRISKLFKDERNYHLLEQLHTLPSVGYLTKIRNKKA